MNLSFTVWGTAQPQGSMKPYTPRGWDRAIITSDNPKLKPWRQEIAGVALSAMVVAKEEVSRDAIGLRIKCYFAKPQSASKRLLHKITRPDSDKILRGVYDALAGIVFKNDAQVVSTHVLKLFGTPERVEIEVRSFAVMVERGATISTDQAERELLLPDEGDWISDDLPPFDGWVKEGA